MREAGTLNGSGFFAFGGAGITSYPVFLRVPPALPKPPIMFAMALLLGNDSTAHRLRICSPAECPTAASASARSAGIKAVAVDRAAQTPLTAPLRDQPCFAIST
jgi:hypothetical protein